MGDETDNTQTQTQNSQLQWSQNNTPAFIPNIWGRLHPTKPTSSGKYCWNASNNPEYIDLIQPEFSLGRSLNCNFVIKKNIVKDNIIKSVSKQQFIIKRDLSMSRVSRSWPQAEPRGWGLRTLDGRLARPWRADKRQVRFRQCYFNPISCFRK